MVGIKVSMYNAECVILFLVPLSVTFDSMIFGWVTIHITQGRDWSEVTECEL